MAQFKIGPYRFTVRGKARCPGCHQQVRKAQYDHTPNNLKHNLQGRYELIDPRFNTHHRCNTHPPHHTLSLKQALEQTTDEVTLGYLADLQKIFTQQN